VRKSSSVLGAGGVGPFLSAAFVITTSTNFTTNNNLVTVSGTAPLLVKDILIDGLVWPVTWNSVTGWTARVALDAGTNSLRVSGIDINAIPSPAPKRLLPLHRSCHPACGQRRHQ
jgi:hypothetical protein